MWEMAASGTNIAEEEAAAEVSGSHRRRWVVRTRRPDLKRGKLVFSSDSRSTEERMEHSISPGRRTGRPLAVSSAGGRNLPAIELT